MIYVLAFIVVPAAIDAVVRVYYFVRYREYLR